MHILQNFTVYFAPYECKKYYSVKLGRVVFVRDNMQYPRQAARHQSPSLIGKMQTICFASHHTVAMHSAMSFAPVQCTELVVSGGKR